MDDGSVEITASYFDISWVVSEIMENNMAVSHTNGRASRMSTPHDLVFKQFLTHSETVRDFMQLHLPAELQA